MRIITVNIPVKPSEKKLTAIQKPSIIHHTSTITIFFFKVCHFPNF